MSTDTTRTVKRRSHKPINVKAPRKSRRAPSSGADGGSTASIGKAKAGKSKAENGNGGQKKKKKKKSKSKQNNGPKGPKTKNPNTLRIKLGRPYGMPKRTFHRLLHDVSWACVLARNAAVDTWYFWKKQNPDWKPGDYYDAPPRRQKVRETDVGKSPSHGDKPMGPAALLNRMMYYKSCEVAPMLSTNVCNACRRHVENTLKTRMPWNHRGQAKRRWEASLLYETKVVSFQNTYAIPLPPANIDITYTQDECKVKLKLLNKHSGWKNRSPEVRLLVGDMTIGQRRLLRKIVHREDGYKYGTCQVAFDEDKNGRMKKDARGKYPDGEWYLCVSFEAPTEASKFPKDRHLVVEPCGGDDPRPFRAYWTNEDGEERSWDIGNGIPYLAQIRRAEDKRRAINRLPRKGHGCRKQASRTKAISRYMANLYPKFREHIVNDIIRLALREQCGTVIYRKPSEPVKDLTWFAENHACMDWEDLEGKLERKCRGEKGFHFQTKRVYKKEWETRNQSKIIKKEANANSQ